MSKGLKMNLFISILCVLIVVCSICCLMACETNSITAYIDGKAASFNSVSEMLTRRPQKSGYTFDCWVYYVNEQPIKVTPNSIPENAKDLVFYATWKSVEYTVTFYIDGVQVGTDTYTLDKLPTMPTIPEKFGYKGEWEEHDFTVAGDVSINAIYTPLTYNITYENLCGATNNNPSSYTYDSEYTLVRPDRIGYNFFGWQDKDGNRIEKIEKGTSGDLILSATWGAQSHSITYTNTKDGDISNLPTSYTIESESISLPELLTGGYTFDGWYMDGTKVEKIEKGTVGDLEIEARWTPIEYTITYNNVEDSINNNPATYTVEGGNITLNEPTKDWYVFNGWYSDSNLSDRVTEIEVSLIKNVSLYADWKMAEYHAYYYSDDKLADTKTFNIESQHWTDPVVPKKNGYTGKWSEYTVTNNDIRIDAQYTLVTYGITYIDLNGADNSNNPTSYTIESPTLKLNPVELDGYDFLGWTEGNLSIDAVATGSYGDRAFTAHWEKIVYTITYENTINADLSNLVESYSIDSNDIVLPISVLVDGYNFVGWFNENDEKVERIAKGSTGNKTFTAKFTPIEYTITYEEVGKAENTNATTYTIESGVVLSPLSRNGYEFLGWFKGDQVVTEIQVGEYGNKTLTAKWDIATYTITYNNTKDADTSGFVSEYTINSETIALPTSLSVEGYIFGGWLNENNEKVERIEKGSYGNRTLTAVFTPIEYTITYEEVGEAENTNATTYTIESGVVLQPLSRIGYAFLGWYDGDLKVTEIQVGEIGNRTFTAKWDIATYTITYSNMKGFDTSTFVSEYRIDSETIVLPTSVLVEGYTFGGWLNENNEKVERIEKGSYGNRTLTAVFTPIEYTITYEEVGEAENTNATTYNIESSVVLQPLSRIGYAFLGWYDGDLKVTEIQVGEIGNKTFTAKWDIATYTITYNNTKEADISGFVSEYRIDSETIALPTDLVVNGYTFEGWLNENGEKVEHIQKGSYGNKIITAELTPIEYTITYLEVGESINPNTSTYTIESGVVLESLTRAGYAFLGWYDGDLQVTEIQVGEYGNKTLTAKWDIAVYSITYTNTFEADTSKFVSSYTIESETFKLPQDLRVLGYTFNGWKNESGAKVTEIKKGSYGDIVLTADLIPTSYDIHLEAMDGSVNKSSITVLYGQSFILPIPSHKNGTFIGWYDNTGDNATAMTDANGNSLKGYPYRASRTFYAHYSIDVFTVTFITDGGTAVAAQKYSKGSLFVESAATTSRDNALFDGWYDATGKKFSDGTPITESIVLKAKWVESVGISDLDGLLAISKNPSGNYHLMNDINLKGQVWTPIENFSGVLDGKGYVLKNFNLSCTSYVPRFAFINVNEGIVKNLGFVDYTYNVSLSDLKNITIALFVAENKGTVEGCVVDRGVIKLNLVMQTPSTITINKKFGTFVGENLENAIVKNCRSSVNITITSRTVNNHYDYGWRNTIQNIYCGGIVGNNLAVIENCSYEATIDISPEAVGNGSYGDHWANNTIFVGGIVGQNQATGICNNCSTNIEMIAKPTNGNHGVNYSRLGGIVGLNYGNISSCRSAGLINTKSQSDENQLGGLVGSNAVKASIVSCYSGTNIILNRNGQIGGFVGYNEGIIQNSYARGTVTSSAGGNVAGFVGNNTSTASISKCYSNGNVSAVSGNVGYFVAASSGTMFKCYYLRSATLILNGQPREYITEYETVNGLLSQILWSKDFLVDEMYWEEEGWVILTNEDPVLNWEISIDDYDLTVKEPDCENMGYSLYVERAGNRFFIRNYVDAWGHSYDTYNKRVVNPTCVAQGYEDLTCIICGHIERTNYTDAIGHIAGEVIEHKDATCEESGYTVKACTVCQTELRTEIAALGHTSLVTIERTNPICGKTDNGEFIETPGLSERIECSVCKKVLQEQTVIQPHEFVLTTTTTEPTCTENGFGTYTCRFENCGKFKEEAIPATGHIDLNQDHRCDTCKVLLGIYEGETVIEIKTAADLLNISSNLHGVYKLMNDIDMKNTAWTTLGTKENPFTGYFEGNGKAIKNLSATMFGYMRGIVHGLTLNYENKFVDLREKGTVGLLAEVNDGSIVSCNIVGNIEVKFCYVTESGVFADTKQASTAVFGGFVYTNGTEGLISDSSVTASFRVVVIHKYTLNTDLSVGTLLNRDYRYKHYSQFGVYFGALVGDNKGTISASSFKGKVDYGTGFEGSAIAKVVNANGHVYVNTDVHLESFAAINNMTIEGCETSLNFTGTPQADSERYFAKFWTESETYNLLIDGKARA